MNTSLLTRCLAAQLCLSLAASASAAPPPGHPTPDDAMRMMRPQGDRPLPYRSGRVLQHMDANQYTYLQVQEGDQALWLAAPKTPLVDGSTVRFPDGVVMRDFYSKLLKRSFAAITFVSAVEPAGI